MTSTVYSQVVHLLAIVAVAVLVALGKIDTATGVGGIGLLVGIALPTPGPLVSTSTGGSTAQGAVPA